MSICRLFSCPFDCFFQWIFVKGTHLKLFWKMGNYQQFSINQKHLLQGKHVFCSTTTSFGTGWEQLSVSTTLPTVHLAQSIVWSVRGKAVPLFFPSILQNAMTKSGDFPCVSTWRTKAGAVVAMLGCQHAWYDSPSFLFLLRALSRCYRIHCFWLLILKPWL